MEFEKILDFFKNLRCFILNKKKLIKKKWTYYILWLFI